MQPNVSDNFSHGDAKTPLNRQAFVTFGDKSWGSVKLGKDIGIFASDAILNDMTLLGVGAGAATSGAATTLGGIGFGYIYAGWKGQVSYTTPNFNGFQMTVGITNPNQASGATLAAASAVYQERFGLEGKASYAFGADNFSGKLWVSGATYEIQQTTTVANSATAADIGAAINAGNVGLTGYYYRGDGAGTTVFGGNGATTAGIKRNSDGGYLQATYKLPTNTIGVTLNSCGCGTIPTKYCCTSTITSVVVTCQANITCIDGSTNISSCSRISNSSCLLYFVGCTTHP